MSSTAKVFEEDIAANSSTALYIENLGDEGVIALLIPEVSADAPVALIGSSAAEFMELLRDNESDDVIIEVCGDAENVHFIQLNSIIIDIGTYILTDAAAPVFLSVFANYIYAKISQYNSNDIEVRVEVVRGKGAKKKKYKISGSAESVLKVVKELEKK
ncbi:hypothetical protein IFR09_11680 [Pseudomonas syringae]|nr:hypothetical protein [Pseudomonas syringae]MBD8801831.1 hypothetical protein [Pseudomonas syringae]MBD8811819.1 hypothetical protein [Pseudomonas syringae]